jgi:hypothetical protein
MQGFSEEHARAVEAILAEKWRQRFARPASTELWNLVNGVNDELVQEIRGLIEAPAIAPAHQEEHGAEAKSE